MRVPAEVGITRSIASDKRQTNCISSITWLLAVWLFARVYRTSCASSALLVASAGATECDAMGVYCRSVARELWLGVTNRGVFPRFFFIFFCDRRMTFMSICCSARADMIYGSAISLDGNLDILDATGRDNGINVETRGEDGVICTKRRRALFHGGLLLAILLRRTWWIYYISFLRLSIWKG